MTIERCLLCPYMDLHVHGKCTYCHILHMLSTCLHVKMNFEQFYDIYMPRLSDKIRNDPESGCQIWTGAVSGAHYGVMKVKLPWQKRSNTFYVHRLAYILFRGNLYINSNLDVSHLCHSLDLYYFFYKVMFIPTPIFLFTLLSEVASME